MVEWQVKKGGTEFNRSLYKGCQPKVPQQNNYSDCGVFMLQYVESFFEVRIRLPENFVKEMACVTLISHKLRRFTGFVDLGCSVQNIE